MLIEGPESPAISVHRKDQVLDERREFFEARQLSHDVVPSPGVIQGFLGDSTAAKPWLEIIVEAGHAEEGRLEVEGYEALAKDFPPVVLRTWFGCDVVDGEEFTS